MKAPTRRIARLVVVGMLATGGCESDAVRIDRSPIQVRFLQHADSLTAGVTDTLWVGALVGHRGCTLENAAVVQSGDSLVVRGNARCVVNDPRIRIATAAEPAVLKAEIFALTLPALAPGEYRLVAGELVDTLVVVAAPPATLRTRIAAVGTLVPTWLPCPGVPAFRTDLVGTAARSFQLANLTLPVTAGGVILSAIRTGASPCTVGGFAGVLHVRWRVPRPPP